MLDSDQIARLIPHGGKMVLLDAVTAWTETRVVCTTKSHHRTDNPLRRDGRLGIASAIEYGMQAMAVHGSLIDPLNNRPGFLASLRDVRFYVGRIDDIADELNICAELLFDDADRAAYSFAIDAGGRQLASGRATVFLR